ncbi:MAG: RNA polymerase sigma factor [Isosphaeraceae bacterium]
MERFAKGREEAAFDVLVKRHGPLVERICRRILRNEQDVEDVFQATFLTLARKAAVVPWQDSVSAWLTTVAHRLALHARTGAARHRGHEIPITALTVGAMDVDGWLPERYHPLFDPAPEIERSDLRRLLDAELRLLPEKYRAPVVLCYLEGWTHEEAAQQLGWPMGSMSRRLERARTLLRRRLARRGLAITIFLAISAVIAAVGVGRAPGHPRYAATLRQAMLPFRTPSHGGQGFGLILAALTEDGHPRPASDQVTRFARQAGRTARLLEGHDPGRLRPAWQHYLREMEESAAGLDRAVQWGDRFALVAEARRLHESCLGCHDIFR